MNRYQIQAASCRRILSRGNASPEALPGLQRKVRVHEALAAMDPDKARAA